jgi:hypothetical protein
MSDFNIDIDTSALVTALKSLDGLGDGWARMVTKVVSENKRMDNAVQQSLKSQLEAKTRLQAADAKTNSDAAFARDRRKIQMMDASAAMELKQARASEVAANAAVKAGNEKVIATNREARELERLKVKYKDGYAAAALYRSMQNEVTKAHKLGAISATQYEGQLESLAAEYTQFANGGAAAGNRFAGAAVGATRRMSSMGVVTQQVGYQVGDFAVQVQSGQSALVAFSQQATQLVGVLPLMSDTLGISAGKLVGISAGLGIAIPVVTALANVLFTSMFDTAKATKEAADEQKNLQESLDGTVESLEDANRAWSDFRQGLLTGESGFTDNLANAQVELDAAIALQIASIEAGVAQSRGLGGINLGGLLRTLTQGSEEDIFSKAVDDAQAKVTAFQEAAAARATQIATDRETEAGNRIALLATEIAFGEDSLAVATELTRQAEEAYRIELAKDGIKAGAEADNLVALMLEERRLDVVLETKTAKEEDLATAEEMLTTLINEAEVQSLINRYGEDSAKVSAERVEQEREAFAVLVSNLDVQQDIKDALNDAYNETVNLAASGAAWADRMADVGAEIKGIMASLASLGGGMLDNAFKQVELDVLEAGGTNLAAGRAADRARMEAEFSARSVGANPFELAEIGVERSNYNLGIELDDDILARQEANNERGRGTSGGSSGSEAADKLDFVQALEAEMAVRGELVKLFGDEYELQSEIARIVKGLGEATSEYDARDIEALAQKNLLLIEQENLREESVKQMQNVYDMLGNEMGTAFTSMIDGTKSVEDAFKSMAKNIIDQLIQIFIVEQMVNSITGGLGGGGGIFGGGGGSKVKFGGTKASGGPIDGGKSYLVGESGPELIIPRDNSEVINNKHLKQMQGGNGSGGDNVVIHQSFNFSANGDDTVRRLIQQAAPQIAQMTKSSMLNDRRRGGQTKSVFG